MPLESCKNGDFLLGDYGDQVNDPENTEEVTGNELQHTNNNAGRITARNAEQCAVNVIENYQQELCDPRQTLESLSKFSHYENPLSK